MNNTYLQECFVCDADAGKLIWRERPRAHFKNGAGWHNFNHQRAGKIAGVRKANGRVEVKLDGRTFKAARIIWIMYYGTAAPDIVDHIDGNPGNDSVENLRAATPAQNAQNRAHTSANSSGMSGVTWHAPAKKWWVRVTLSGRTHSFGLYKSLGAAAAAAYAARQKLFGEFARHA